MLVQIKLEDEIAEKIKSLAKKEDRSVRKMIKILLIKYLELEEKDIKTEPQKNKCY